MSRTRSRLLLLAIAAGLAAAGCGGESDPGTLRPFGNRLLIVIEDRVSFEELLAVPEFAQVARNGGAALMTTHARQPTAQERAEEFPLEDATIAWGTTSVPDGGGTSPVAAAIAGRGIPVCSYADPAQAGPLSRFLAGTDRIDPCGDLAGPDLHVVLLDDGATRAIDEQTCVAGPEAVALRSETLAAEGKLVAEAVDAIDAPNASTEILVVTPSVSCRMRRAGDEVTPVILGFGHLNVDPTRPIEALSSATSRRTGLIPNVDIAPTILRLLPASIPDAMDGQPLRFSHGPAPFDRHRLHLDQRRIRVPVQVAELGFVVVVAVLALLSLLVAGQGGLPRRWAAAIRFLILAGVAVMIPASMGGWLPRLTARVVIPYLVVTVIALALVAAWLGSTQMGPFAVLGVIGLVVLAADAAARWQGLGVPLIGGTMFDGVRFYGLPNAFLFLLVGSALFVARKLPRAVGFWLLVLAALFAGLPWTGADVGGAATLFVAAGLWWALRIRHRVGLLELLGVLVLAAAGVAAVLVANRLAPGPPTHVAVFVERATEGTSAWDTVRHRLALDVRQLRSAPAALIPLLGLPALGALALWRPGAIGRGLDIAGRGWRDVVLILSVTGMVAFAVNDTGVAAAAPAFLYAMAALVYPAIAARRAT